MTRGRRVMLDVGGGSGAHVIGALSAMLADAGFTSIETIPSVGDFSLVTGVKPR
ncbi:MULTISPECIES: hypothetical protein [Burkholderia]|uniref:hypothetical protein n=1 Tax=Burkholderia TaxID=32008 RepID=UPI0012E3F7D0|nr:MULTISPECIES: hypothetical protein [Burkholderia]